MIKDYIIKETLGKGTYGIVYKVQKKDTNDIYVIKQISLLGLTNKEKDEVNQEAEILSKINSDFVVKYYASFKEQDNIYIVMEYCDGGDLNDFINEKKQIGKLLEEDLIWQIFIKITIGLSDIHKMKILHRDLKTLNIFLKKNMEIKIGDLGVAKILLKNSFAKTVIGTPFYLSPEICQEKPYNDKSDVWALGCILYELCTFNHPFDARSQGALILKILNNKPDPIDNYYSQDLNDLIFMLLDKNYEKRPTCAEILKKNIVINKMKVLGLKQYISKTDILGRKYYNNNPYNNNYNVKISNKILDFNSVNITNKYCSKNNSKDNIYKNKNINIIRPISKNQNNKNHVSAVYLIDNIKNKNLKFNNINQQIIHRRKNSDIKVNVIAIEDTKNKRPLSSAVNNKKHNEKLFLKYNQFCINNNEKSESNKYNIKNEDKDIISKKYNKMCGNDNSNIISKKINIIKPIKIISKNSDAITNNKINNLIEPKINLMINKNRNEKQDYKNIKELKNEKNIKYNYIKKNIIHSTDVVQKDKKNNEVPIKIKEIPEKSFKFNNQKEKDDDISTTKTDKNQNYNNNKNNKEHVSLINKNKKYNIIKDNNNNKNSNSNSNNLNILLTKPKKTNNENKNKNRSYNNEIKVNNINIKKIEIKNDSFVSKEDNIIFNDKIILNFDIINNNNLQNNKNNIDNNNNNNNNNKLIMTNENEDSMDEMIINNQKGFSPKINKDNNIIHSENSYNEEDDENVKILKEINNEDLQTANKEEIENRNLLIKNDINKLKEKIKKYKNEMLLLIGENDYNYIMNLYNKGIKEQNKIDEIYEKIEEYANKNYSENKKEQFNNCYLSLVSLEYELGSKEKELKNIN